MLSNVLKIPLAVVLGGVATTSSSFALSEQFASKYPLVVQQLDQFKKSYGFDSCYQFLNEDNKISLLFVCLKKMGSNNGDKTHSTKHYFYNGGTWEEAISLRKNPYADNSILVKTKSGWFWNKERGIKNYKEQESDLGKFGLNKECRFESVQVKGHELNNRIFKCSVGGIDIKWKLSEFK
ncbi:hypothetical protein OVS_02045 [Mycoplasma ovis str. Michigan]|uniref:Uncharacterized protein n=1 Tax=Mycoplasma ovis str. Michigan TaxID=1415773 RepID=A0ABM5P1B2_9MOLU|nr:hypothetical protein [Mycoplasma ovis]AHC40272.1 hypothetical protein OVS_02045 [Mycoplasma ovis str. Michigan]